MNANELADKLEGDGIVYVKFEHRKQAATMLRAQQEQINNLKQWEKRYLDVIESLSQDSKQALNPELRTHNGRLE
jgi:alpha-beta hydrolase superfamily lysophospholipase